MRISRRAGHRSDGGPLPLVAQALKAAIRSALVGAGRDATVPGAGGSGSSQLNGAASAVDGGDGANGIVIVWEHLK